MELVPAQSPRSGAHGRRPVGDHSADNQTRLLDHAGLMPAWRSGQCSHRGAVATAHGLRCTPSCRDCGNFMAFALKFGRPKTFDVADGDGRPVGGV